jgi:uncharacterized protein involved in exopolysaccharide biosynthesis
MSLASSPSRPSLRRQFVDADFDLAGLGALLWQKRYSILRPTIIVALLTLAVVLMIPPKYQSEARVLVIGRDNVYLRPDADKDIIDRGVVDQEAVTSQAQLILSRDLASEIIAKLKLNELPEFDPALGNLADQTGPRRHQKSARHDAGRACAGSLSAHGLSSGEVARHRH